MLLETIARDGVVSALRKARGMFAIAVYDSLENKIFLAVDRMGEKPLYYAKRNSQLAFASELKALHGLPFLQPAIDRSSLTQLLRYNFIAAPHTIFEDVFKLEAGSLLTVELNSNGCEIFAQRYWNLRETVNRSVSNRLELSDKEAIDATESQLLRAVEQQMVADVPIGALLSGGYDSSVITAMMQQISSKPVKTFSIGLAEKGFDESEAAIEVAKLLGTEHTNLVVRPEDALNMVGQMKEIYCEPFADASQIPTALVARLARENVTVALSGDGGDELFGGYNRHFKAPELWNKMQVLPVAVRKLLRSLFNLVPRRLLERLLSMLTKSTVRPAEKFDKLMRVFHAGSKVELYQLLASIELSPEDFVLGGRERLDIISSNSDLPTADCSYSEHMMYWDTSLYLNGDILTKVDRASMATSLELRVPFLDLELLEFAWQLPERFKIRGGQGKWVIKQIAHRHLPQKLMERPKMGFSIPVAKWLRTDLKDWATAMLSFDKVKREGFFDPKAVQQIMDQHMSGSQDWGNQLWSLVMFQEWHEAWGPRQ